MSIITRIEDENMVFIVKMLREDGEEVMSAAIGKGKQT